MRVRNAIGIQKWTWALLHCIEHEEREKGRIKTRNRQSCIRRTLQLYTVCGCVCVRALAMIKASTRTAFRSQRIFYSIHLHNFWHANVCTRESYLRKLLSADACVKYIFFYAFLLLLDHSFAMHLEWYEKWEQKNLSRHHCGSKSFLAHISLLFLSLSLLLLYAIVKMSKIASFFSS